MRRVHLILITVVFALIFFAVIISTSTQATLLQQISVIFLGVLSGMATIAEIIGLFDRLGVPERIFPIGPKNMEREQSPFDITVAVWGPVSSGKSWLVHSFGRIIALEYQKHLGLEYRLSKIDQTPILTLGQENISGTASIDFSNFKFERRKTSNNFFQSMSSFTHNILIYDNPGGYTSTIGNDAGNPDNTLNPIIANLAHADIVILALDPTKLNYNSYYDLSDNNMLVDSIGSTEDEYDFRITPHEYTEMVKNLFSVLEKHDPEKKRLYAVCITKADMLAGGMIFLNPDAVIEAYFGPEMSAVLKVPQKGVVATFTTSAFGFLPNSTIPNKTQEEPRLKDERNWRPYGVEFPFFQAFEIQERKRLQKILQNSLWGRLTYYSNYKNYISYPKPKYKV